MPEAPVHLASFQRSRPALKLIAVALCATAFLLPGAHAASKKAVPAGKKAVATAGESKRGAQPARAAKAEAKGGSKVAASKRTAKAEPAERVVRGGRNVVASIHKKNGKTVIAVQRRSVVRVADAPPRLSFGQMAGLHATEDALDLKSSAALVIDQDTREVLFSKNDHAVLPIASLTKLMTGLLISEAQLPMDELITITQDDVDTEKGSRSRLTVGTTLSRGELLHLALMSSENRAAHALGRTYPGGLSTFVSVMNAKAKMLGMRDTRYVEPTGLSFHNQSTAQDLAVLVSAASADSLVRQLSTSPEHQVEVGNRVLQYNTTNRLVRSPEWNIGLQKTGYISEAGQCLVMQARVAGRKLIMVFLDSAGKFSRIADAERVRRWVENGHMMHTASAQIAGD
jgi:D-alanyl-D-alanine endopeptidase (penicillin-binding protein 7)